MEVVTAGAQDELMQSLDYKLKTSNTSYVTARHDVQYFLSSLSSFSPTTSWVCRIPLTSGTSFIDPESIKIAFRVRNTDGANPLAPATPNPACFVQRVQVFANGQRCDDINYYGRTVAVHDLLKGRVWTGGERFVGCETHPNSLRAPPNWREPVAHPLTTRISSNLGFRVINPLASPNLGGTRCALDKSHRAALGGAATSHAAGLSGMGVRRATLASAERRALR